MQTHARAAACCVHCEKTRSTGGLVSHFYTSKKIVPHGAPCTYPFNDVVHVQLRAGCRTPLHALAKDCSKCLYACTLDRCCGSGAIWHRCYNLIQNCMKYEVCLYVAQRVMKRSVKEQG